MVKNEMRRVLFQEGKEKFIEFGEVSLDNFLEDGFLKDIPVVGSLFTAIKVGKTIKEYHFTKKLIRFISKLNNEVIEDDKLEEFKMRLYQDEEYASKVTETIFISIERLDKEIKAEVYARLFSKYIEGIYSWDDLIYHTDVIEQLFISDFTVIQKLISINKKIKIDDLAVKNLKVDKIRGSIERMRGIGFVSITTTTHEAVQSYYKSSIILSKLGAKFYNCCIHGIDFSIDKMSIG